LLSRQAQSFPNPVAALKFDGATGYAAVLAVNWSERKCTQALGQLAFVMPVDSLPMSLDPIVFEDMISSMGVANIMLWSLGLNVSVMIQVSI
jgi:hypothetical protein